MQHNKISTPLRVARLVTLSLVLGLWLQLLAQSPIEVRASVETAAPTLATIHARAINTDTPIPADQDTWIWKDKSHHNYGACDEITLDAAGGGLGHGRLLTHFDLSGIPAGTTITSAQLKLTKIGGDDVAHNIEVHRVTALWDEGVGDCDGLTVGSSWDRRQDGVNWDTDGGDFDAAVIDTTVVNSAGAYTWNVTTAAQDWISGAQPNHGLLLGTVDTGTEMFQFASREHANNGYRPQLIITHSGGSVSGAVWHDEDADGQRGIEMGINGITVELFSGVCGEQNAPSIATATTDGDGDYQFIVDPGDYCMAVVQSDLPAGVINTTAGNMLSVTATGGQSISDQDFGYATSLTDDRLSVGLSVCTDVSWLVNKVASYGGRMIDGQFDTCTFIVEVPPAEQAALQSDLQDEPDTAFADQDVRVRGTAEFPDDPDYSNPNLVFAPQQINAIDGWKYTLGDPNLIIAVLDSGIDKGHEEFSGRLLPGYDYVNEDGDPADDEGHGTHVAGIAAAGTNNNIGMAGIAGGSKILPMKVLNANNLGYWSDVAQAIMDGVDQGAKVVNLSITGPSPSNALEQAIQYAGQHGAVVVVAAGNDGTDAPQYPASYVEPNLISVGATAYGGDRWTSSNHGPNVAIMAPGQFIHSTYWQIGAANGYAFLTGTSMATPHVAGAAALLLSIDPSLTPPQIIQFLTSTATDMGASGFDPLNGHGFLNLGAAADAVAAAIPPPPMLSLTKAVDKSVAVPGEILNYTVTLDYDGDALARGVAIIDNLSSSTAYVTNSANAGGVESDGVITWALGDNEAGIPGHSFIAGGPPVDSTGVALWSPGATPSFNRWGGNSFEGATTSGVNIGDNWRIMQGAAAPASGEKIAVGIEAGKDASGMVWNGISWNALPALTGNGVTETSWWGVDVTYEQLSGDAVIVWNNGNTGTTGLSYAIWDGSDFSGQGIITVPLSGEPKQVRLASKPGADEVALVVASTGGDYAMIWNGTGWGNYVELDGPNTNDDWSGSNADFTDIHVTYEQERGRVMAVYGTATGLSLDYALHYKIWDGLSWTPASANWLQPYPTIPTASRAKWITVASDPNSDRIVAGVQTSAGDGWMAVWDGAAWGTPAEATPNTLVLGSTSAPNLAVAFERDSGQAIVVYGHSGQNSLFHRTWSDSSWSSEFSGPTLGANSNSLALYSDPNDDEIMLLAQDDASDLHSFLWSGDSFGTDSVLETATGEIENQPFVYLWDNVFSIFRSVSQISDDAEEMGPGALERTPGSVYISSSDLELVQDLEDPISGIQTVGIRFQNIAIPPGATITNAYLSFYAIDPDNNNTNNNTANLLIQGQDADSASTFVDDSSSSKSISDTDQRPRTSASTPWAPTAWTTGNTYNTPDVSTVVQEIVDRGGWATGNNMVFIITGTGSRSAESWDHPGVNPTELHIGYTLAPSGNLDNAIAAAPTLITAGDQITVRMTLSASDSVANVTPNTPVVTGTNGVSATLASGPTPATGAVSPSGRTFTWVYDTSAAGAIGALLFSGDAAGHAATWPSAESNSIIVAPPLTFQSKVNSPAGVETIFNIARLFEAGDAFDVTASNTVATSINSTIGDTVWADSDGDGIQDGAESGIAGVTVRLTDVLSRTVTTVTDASGQYDFGGLEAGSYTVALDISSLPPEYTLFTTLHPLPVTLGQGHDFNGADIGLKPLATGVGDFIWYDANGDGKQGVGEPGIGNVTLQLFLDDDGNGDFDPGKDFPVDAAVSNANGGYVLHAPIDGAYFVVISDDHGILNGLLHTLGPNSISTPLPAIVLTTDAVNLDVDYGYLYVPSGGQGVILGQIWHDGNGNRVRNAGEPILIGESVCGTPAGGGAAICDQTDLNGRYLLDLPAGVWDVAPVSAPAGMTATTSAPYQVKLLAGEQHTDVDFGYNATPPELGSAGGEIWQDIAVNDVVDGVFDHATEPGIGNVSVNLIRDLNDDDDWDQGEPILATVSNTDGQYRFDHLLSGDYLFEVSDTMLVLRTFAQTVAGPDPDADDNNHAQPYPLFLNPGEDNQTIDFGYREYEVSGAGQIPDPGVIGNQVWIDMDDNGLYNPSAGDQPVPGVTVDLLQAGQVVRTTTTGGDGVYLFTDLSFGTYAVQVSDHFGVLAGHGVARMGSSATADNHNKPQPYTATISFIQTTDDRADFGYLPDMDRGDCNLDDTVDAGDISALTLEIFDGDTSLPGLAPGGSFAGSPAGCNANGDAVVDAGDISCLILLIFDGQGACKQAANAARNGVDGAEPSSPQAPALAIPRNITTDPGGVADAPVAFDTTSGQINSLLFSIDFDEVWLALDDRDEDGDGIPDSISFSVPESFATVASFDAADTDGELDLILFTLTPGVVMPDGTPVTITLDAGTPASSTEAIVNFSTDPAPSFGNVDGASVAGGAADGSILILVDGTSAPSRTVFLPVVQR